MIGNTTNTYYHYIEGLSVPK